MESGFEAGKGVKEGWTLKFGWKKEGVLEGGVLVGNCLGVGGEKERRKSGCRGGGCLIDDGCD